MRFRIPPNENVKVNTFAGSPGLQIYHERRPNTFTFLSTRCVTVCQQVAVFTCALAYGQLLAPSYHTVSNPAMNSIWIVYIVTTIC